MNILLLIIKHNFVCLLDLAVLSRVRGNGISELVIGT